MNINATTQSITDDQELAKVLAGIGPQVGTAAAAPQRSQPVMSPQGSMGRPSLTNNPGGSGSPVSVSVMSSPSPAPTAPSGDALNGVKQSAIKELRPLVEKLNVSPEEKFDTYLLLIRSTDDKSLVDPAYQIAKNIRDETRRAQALLDIIKEVDYLSQR